MQLHKPDEWCSRSDYYNTILPNSGTVLAGNISVETLSIIGQSFGRVPQASNHHIFPTNDGICVKCLVITKA